MKTCIDCGGPTGSNARKRCLKCIVIKRNATQRANRAKYQYHKQPKARYANYKQSAERRGYTFDISLEEFMLHWNKPCYYCGSEIPGIGLSRKDTTRGYFVENIIPCCISCNFMKKGMGHSDFINRCILVASTCGLPRLTP